jgi:heme/copper-type cytochrome/quinol oxidase subunit 2
LVSADLNTQLYGVVIVLLVIIEFVVLFWEVRRNRDENREKRGGGTDR